ncbi:MAG TPA: hypothetical protein VHZ25_10215 [Acidobacteriaceae bacterium]|jgi:hypothetical protein|nr:hypothetical protein [Acidobacteriaceae bacterium]
MARSPDPNSPAPHFLPLVSALALALFLPAPAPAQAAPPAITDSAALVRRAIANHLAAEAAHHPQRFVLHKKDDRHDYTQAIIETRQGDVALAIAANGKPLNADLHQAQIDRLNVLDTHPELQEHRHKREQEDAARADKLMRMLPDAFLYQYEDLVPCAVAVSPNTPNSASSSPPADAPPASDCYHLTFKPNPAWNPPDIESKILRGMAGEAWIEKSQERLTRLSAQLITDVDFGWGIVGHLDKGGTVFLEQSEMTPHNWELSRMKLNFTGKALLVKSLNIHLTEEMANYSPVPRDLDYHKAIQMLESDPPPHK